MNRVLSKVADAAEPGGTRRLRDRDRPTAFGAGFAADCVCGGRAGIRKPCEGERGFFRPGATVPLVGNAAKISRELGWTPGVSFEEMIRGMGHELELLQQGGRVRVEE